jgi:hypothetical protein
MQEATGRMAAPVGERSGARALLAALSDPPRISRQK